MKIVPQNDPLDGSDSHELGTDIVIGVNNNEGGDNHPTTSSPKMLLVPPGDILVQMTDLISALSSNPSTIKVFAENEDTSKVVSQLNALLKTSRHEKEDKGVHEREDQGEGEGADAGGVGSRVMEDRDEAPRGLPRRLTTMKVKLDTDGEVLAEYINSLCITKSVPGTLPACGVGL